MAQRIALERAFDANGNIAPGAVAYFYEKGTTTPLTVYSDESGLISTGTFVTADATGTFAPTYTTQAVTVEYRDAENTALPGNTSDGAITANTDGVAADTIAYTPSEGLPVSNVGGALDLLGAFKAAFTTVGNAIATAASAAAARTELGLGTAAVADLIDEDSFATDSATRPPSQQSTKAYIGTAIADYTAPVEESAGSAPYYAARAFAKITDGALVAGRNIASVGTDVGNTTVTFTTAMQNANYVPIVTSTGTGGDTRYAVVDVSTIATTGFEFTKADSTTGTFFVVVFGD